MAQVGIPAVLANDCFSFGFGKIWGQLIIEIPCLSLLIFVLSYLPEPSENFFLNVIICAKPERNWAVFPWGGAGRAINSRLIHIFKKHIVCVSCQSHKHVLIT